MSHDVDPKMIALLREAVDAEADAAPGAADLWARTRRRIRRRRAARVGSALAATGVVAVLVVDAVTELVSPEPGVVFDEPAVPAGWRDVAVGGALVSVPAAWQVLDDRGRGVDERCPSTQTPTLWLRDHLGLGLGGACDPAQLASTVQAGALASGADGVVVDADGDTVRLGAVAAWRATRELSDEQWEHVAGGRPVGAPTALTAWLAPAIDLSVLAPADFDAAAVLDTVRPRETPDADAVVLLVDERGMGLHDQPREYAAVDADGRRHVWFTEPPDVDDMVSSAYTLRDWPGLAGDRFAVVEVTDVHGVRVVAGRPDGGRVVWGQPDAARDLTDGSFPQAAWSPDGTALAWYAPRAEPVMGIAQWDDLDAIADGQPPAREQTVTVADGPVQADPPVTSWTVDDTGQWVLSLNRGEPPPWDPAIPFDERGSYRWQLPLGPDADGRIRLPDPATFERHQPRPGEDQPHRDDATGPRDPSTAEQEAMTAAEDACAQPGPALTGVPRVRVTNLPDGFVQRDTAVDTGSYAGFWDPLEPDDAIRDQVEALLVDGEWDPAGTHVAVTAVTGPVDRLCQMMRQAARQPGARAINLRDRHGLQFSNTLVWIEHPGLMIQLLGNDISDDAIRTVAEGLDIPDG